MSTVDFRERSYREACDLLERGFTEQAALVFKRLGDYRDSRAKLAACEQHMEKTAHEKNLEKESELQIQIARNKIQKGRILKRLAILAVLTALVIAGILLYTQWLVPKSHYEKGLALLSEGQDNEAIAEFQKAGDYADADTQIRAFYYRQGEAMRSAHQWTGAVAAFIMARDYQDAENQVLSTYYQEGMYWRDTANWNEAVKAFQNAGTYSDAAEQALRTRYMEGESKAAAGDWKAAAEAFEGAGNYKDAAAQRKEALWQYAEAMRKTGEYREAYKAYSLIPGYRDTDDILAFDPDMKRMAVLISFRITGYLDVYDANQKKTKRNKEAEDALPMLEGSFYSPSLEVIGLSDTMQPLRIAAVIDGYDEWPLQWNDDKIGPGWTVTAYMTDISLLQVPGQHEIRWFVNEAEALTFTYTVAGHRDASDPEIDSLRNQTIQPDVVTEEPEDTEDQAK